MTAWETAMEQIKALKAENERLREALEILTKVVGQDFEYPWEYAMFVQRTAYEALTASGKEVTEATK